MVKASSFEKLLQRCLLGTIDSYFGATVEGFATYRYYDSNTGLRSWICPPSCMGLMDRRAGMPALA